MSQRQSQTMACPADELIAPPTPSCAQLEWLDVRGWHRRQLVARSETRNMLAVPPRRRAAPRMSPACLLHLPEAAAHRAACAQTAACDLAALRQGYQALRHAALEMRDGRCSRLDDSAPALALLSLAAARAVISDDPSATRPHALAAMSPVRSNYPSETRKWDGTLVTLRKLTCWDWAADGLLAA
jgi:hypothetical protein